MNVTTIGIDLAKLVFQVHGVDDHGNAVIRKQLKRTEVANFFAQLAGVPDRDGGVQQCAPSGRGSSSRWGTRSN